MCIWKCNSYLRACRVTWIDGLICEWAASKMSTCCPMKAHKEYQQKSKLYSEFHHQAVYKDIFWCMQQMCSWSCSWRSGFFLENGSNLSYDITWQSCMLTQLSLWVLIGQKKKDLTLLVDSQDLNQSYVFSDSLSWHLTNQMFAEVFDLAGWRFSLF